MKKSIDFGIIQTEINEGRPVNVAFNWKRDGGHVVIVYGWKQEKGDNYVKVRDPWPKMGTKLINYQELTSAYNMGRWTDTWINIQPY